MYYIKCKRVHKSNNYSYKTVSLSTNHTKKHHESTQVDSSTYYAGYTHERSQRFTPGLQVQSSDIHTHCVLHLRL